MFSGDIDKTKTAWKTIANELGLTFECAEMPSLIGRWEEHRVHIKVFEEKRAGETQIYTGFEMHIDHAFHTSFQLTRQGIVQSLAELVGSKDIQIGIPPFDDTVLVKGWNEEVVQFLNNLDDQDDVQRVYAALK